MKIRINGKDRTIDRDNLTISEVLSIEEVKSPETVSVQHNGLFVLRENFGSTLAVDGDEIDYLYFMGGGR